MNPVFHGRDMHFIHKDQGAQEVIAGKSSSPQIRLLLWARFCFNGGFIDLSSFVRFRLSFKLSMQDLKF